MSNSHACAVIVEHTDTKKLGTRVDLSRTGPTRVGDATFEWRAGQLWASLADRPVIRDARLDVGDFTVVVVISRGTKSDLEEQYHEVIYRMATEARRSRGEPRL